MYSFSIESVVAPVLTERNVKGGELPISFMSNTFHDYELRYSESKNEALSLLK